MPTVDLTRIGSNIGAMYSLQSLLDINNKLAATQQRLSTGKRINSAADDPAGLTIATKMSARSEGLKVVQDNISDAQNMLSVAEGGLSKINDILVKMRAKATQAASDTLGATERQTIQSQLSQFAAQVDDLINETKWNGVQLLDGTASKTFQTGVDAGETTTWSLSEKHDATTLDISEHVDYAKVDSESEVGTTFPSAGGGIGTSQPVLNSLSTIKTGQYTVKILDKAQLTTAKSTLTSNTYATGITGIAGHTTATAELASGNYTFQVLNTHQSTTTAGRYEASWRVLNSDGAAVAGADDENWTAGGAHALTSTVGLSGSIGLQVTTAGTAFTAGQTFSFEHIAKNEAKYELRDGSGGQMTVDEDGSAGTAKTGNYGYFDIGTATANTGRGFTFTHSTTDTNVVAQDTLTFNFLEGGSHVVDVSSASKAASYMNKLTAAMDTVNQSMADLGSLMARMTIKSEASSTARINVESAYNRIMNANMAEEQVNASKYMVLQQTAVAMLAQANQAPQALLSLFQ